MSVYASKRKKSNVQFLDTAMDLWRYSRAKALKFPKRRTFYGGARINELAAYCCNYVRAANGVYVNNQTQLDERTRYLNKAYQCLQNLYDEITLAYEDCIISLNAEEAWIAMIHKEMELIQGVKKTDKARFLKLKAGKTSS